VWFQSKCPVNAEEKAWIERRMVWLDEQFGRDRLLRFPVVLPTVEFFPDPYRGTEEDARAVHGRVCGYMGIDPGRVHLGFYSEKEPDLGEGFRREGRRQGTAGLHRGGERPEIWIETSRLDDPAALVATLAHELGHVHLLDDGRLSHDEADHERLTDLLTVYFGFGVLRANAYLREKRTEGLRYTTWSLSRSGYLLAPAYGYALSLFTWARGEPNPPWARELRLDVRQPFSQGLRYLRKTRDSAFRPTERA
jgi:hypothetical protein